MAAVTRRTPGDCFAGYSELETTTCGVCGVLFAPPEVLLNHCRENGASFFCPNGHSLVFNDYENKRLKKQLKIAEERSARLLAQRDQAEASASAQKAQATRARNELKRIKARIDNGVCPCCNRSFKNVHRHMKSQHPDFTIPEP